MNLHSTLLIFAKEFRDILRDRRTLISMVLLPILLYPLMMGGISLFMKKHMDKVEARVSKVAWIDNDNSIELLKIIESIDGLEVLPGKIDSAMAMELIREREIEVIAIIPAGFSDSLNAVLQASSDIDVPGIRLYANMTRTQSEFTVRKITQALVDYRSDITAVNLRERGFPAQMVRPFIVYQDNIASAKEVGSFVLGSFLPYILILMALTGAMYPAIDLTAGEKERGTLETLLVSGVSRIDIVMGKFLTVFSASLITAILAVGSIALSGVLAIEFIPEVAGKLEISIGLREMGLMIMGMVPLSIIFSSLLMTLALFAKSYREAQSYVSPLMFIVILPSMASMMPDIQGSKEMALIPVMNVSILLKEGLSGNIDVTVALITMAVNLVFSAVCLFLVLRMFKRESVLFRV